MIKSIFTNLSGILLSRVLGFLRDLLSASILGVNVFSDIFFVAFKLPNLFRSVFAEGAFSQSFLPSFMAAKYKSAFVYATFVKLGLSVIVLSIFVNIFSASVTKLIAFGFDDATIKIASHYTGLIFYYLDLIFIVSFLTALLQYKKHFATSAFGAALLNIALIAALLIAKDKEKIQIVSYLSYGVLVGGALQVFVHLVASYKFGLLKLFVLGKRAKKTSAQDNKRFNKSFVPAVFGASSTHLAVFLDTFLASFIGSGAISYMYYANRVFQLPLGLFAIAVSTALFPRIARAIKNNNIQRQDALFKKSFWLLAFLLGASCMGGIVLAEPIVKLLFERGEFNASDTLKTMQILQMYMLGLLPFGLAKIFNLWLYSTHKQKKAAIIVAISLAVNSILAVIFMFFWQEKGLALASSIGGFILFFLVLKEFGFRRFALFLDPLLLGGFVLAMLVEYLILKILLAVLQ